jgi:CubicO group peptidase (beta-lactamase class C family)
VWERAAPKALGFHGPALEAALTAFARRGATSIMVIARGRLIASSGDLAAESSVHSIRKSLSSALYGLAIADGRMDLDATLAELGEDGGGELTAGEQTARVRDLLAARSGVYLPASAESPLMAETRPERGSHAAGEHFYYNNFDFNTLERIYLRAGAGPIGEAFHRRVAMPIGMQDFDAEDVFTIPPWPSDDVAYQYRMTTRDLARFGLLYLRDGDWCGRRVIPEGWVDESTRSRGPATWLPMQPPSGYGYLWWVTSPEGRLYPGSRPLPYAAFGASGLGGQNMAVIPSLRLLVVSRVDTGQSWPGFVWWYLFGTKLTDGDFVALVHDVLEARRP